MNKKYINIPKYILFNHDLIYIVLDIVSPKMAIFFLSFSRQDSEWHLLEEEGGIQQMCKCSWADV